MSKLEKPKHKETDSLFTTGTTTVLIAEVDPEGRVLRYFEAPLPEGVSIDSLMSSEAKEGSEDGKEQRKNTPDTK